MSYGMESLDLVTRVMQRIYSATLADMGTALERLSSGRRFSYASQDLAGFAKVTDLQISQSDYARRNAGLKQASAELGTALSMANEVMEDLAEMKKAWKTSEEAALDSPEYLAAVAKATALGDSIASTLAMTFDGTRRIIGEDAAYMTVETADGASTDLSSEIAAVAPWLANPAIIAVALTTSGDTQAAIDGLSEWIGVVGSLKAQVDSQQRISETMLTNSKAIESAITSYDEAAEMARYIDADVRQQAALSYLSQANLARLNVLALYE